MKSMQKGFTLIELMIVVAIIAILAAIAIPQYQAYVIRSQVSRVMGETGDQKVVVEDCLNNGAVAALLKPGTPNTGDPSCVETAASSDLMVEPSVPVINIGGPGADSTIVGSFGRHANSVLTGGSVTWTRSLSGAWACTTQSVSSTYVPPSCPNG